MSSALDSATVKALFAAAAVNCEPQQLERTAAWVGAQLAHSRTAFDARAFEAEPAGFTLELRRSPR